VNKGTPVMPDRYWSQNFLFSWYRYSFFQQLWSNVSGGYFLRTQSADITSSKLQTKYKLTTNYFVKIYICLYRRDKSTWSCIKCLNCVHINCQWSILMMKYRIRVYSRFHSYSSCSPIFHHHPDKQRRLIATSCVDILQAICCCGRHRFYPHLR